jgi:hypothetical protein
MSWRKYHSKLLDKDVIVFNYEPYNRKRVIKKFRDSNPDLKDLPVYTANEIEELNRFKADKEAMLLITKMKDMFDGFIVRDYERTRN